MYFVSANENIIEEESMLRFVRLTEKAHAPVRARPDSSGFLLFSAYDYEIEPMEKRLVLTDLQIAVPYGCYARLVSLWKLAYQNSIQVIGELNVWSIVNFYFYLVFNISLRIFQ